MDKESRRPRRLVTAVVVFALLLAACGSETSTTTTADDVSPTSAGATTTIAGDTTTTAGETDTTAATDDLISVAQSLIAGGREGLLYYPGPEIEIVPQDMEILGPDDWRGPTSAPTPPEDPNIHVLSCAAGTGCETVGRAAVEAMEALGWEPTFVQAQGTPESYSQVFASAIADQPDGIIAIALPASQVSDKIAEARDAGIKLVASAAINEGGADEYDVYMTLLEAFAAQMQAYWAIADSDGTAKVVLLWDYGYPHLVQAAEEALEVLESCEGCEILEVARRTVVEAADPVAMQRITNSLIQKYGDDLEYILTPYGFGVAPVIEAVRASGRTDIKVLSKNAELQNLGAVAAGDQAADFAPPIEWAGWASVDQMIRLLAGEEPLEPWEQGIGVHVFEPDNTPSDGVVDWTPLTDYKAQYRALWGID